MTNYPLENLTTNERFADYIPEYEGLHLYERDFCPVNEITVAIISFVTIGCVFRLKLLDSSFILAANSLYT